MVSTRAKTEPLELPNPLNKLNWLPILNNNEEFITWMDTIRQRLAEWLRDSKDRAQDEKIKESIKHFTRNAKKNWKQYKVQTDVQTGEVYDGKLRRKMEIAMNAENRKRTELHKGCATWQKFVEYRTAQAAWEDFLYYQDVWNRKNKDLDLAIATETAAEKRESEYETSSKKNKGADSYAIKAQVRGTTGSNTMERTNDFPSGEYQEWHLKWVEHIVDVFKKFHFGYRKHMPTIVGPDEAHRYTQPPRGTTPQSTSRYKKRYRHLEERFPRKRRRVIDPNEVEETPRKRIARQKDNELQRKGQMIQIVWETDEDRFQELKLEKESAVRATAGSETATVNKTTGNRTDTFPSTSFASDRRTRKLLPKGHQLHHGSTETSFDWPTSFESNDWGNTESKTSRKIVRSYEMLSYSDDEDEDEKSIKKLRVPRYIKDDQGNMVRKASKGRYERHQVKEPGRTFVFERDELGIVLGRDREGEWRGKWVEGEVENEEFVLDEEGQRVPETPKQVGHYLFWTTVVPAKSTRSSRRDRHEDKNVTDQLSDDEGEQLRDKNFRLSGNANPDQVGKPTNWEDTDDNQNDEGDGNGDLDDDDEESDDEGDLFRQSYQECSGTAECPFRKQAKEMLAALHRTHGVHPYFQLEEMVCFVKDGIPLEEAEAEYVRMIKLVQMKHVE